MTAARRAAERAEFAHALFEPGGWVVDVGCGPASITLGRSGVTRNRSKVDFVMAAPHRLPVPDASMDAVFAHALFEHWADSAKILEELHRVLKTGGRLAVSTSDWSRARLRPKTANVDAALRGHYLLHRRAGGNPFAGRTIATEVAAAGFTAITTRTRYREDQPYKDLATQVHQSLVTALNTPGNDRDRDQLASAARSAHTWSQTPNGDFSQCWTDLTATK